MGAAIRNWEPGTGCPGRGETPTSEVGPGCNPGIGFLTQTARRQIIRLILTGRGDGTTSASPAAPFQTRATAYPGRRKPGILTVAPSPRPAPARGPAGSLQHQHHTLIGGGCFRPNLQRLNQIIGTAMLVDDRRPRLDQMFQELNHYQLLGRAGHEPAIPVPIAYQMEQGNGAIPAVTIGPARKGKPCKSGEIVGCKCPRLQTWGPNPDCPRPQWSV